MPSPRAMSKRRRRLGQWGEAQAIRHLEAQGCQVVAANWRCTAGEVDVVVRDGDWLAFIEVRTRRGEAYGSPAESITARKLDLEVARLEDYRVRIPPGGRTAALVETLITWKSDLHDDGTFSTLGVDSDQLAAASARKRRMMAPTRSLDRE